MKIIIVNGKGGSGKALCNSLIIPTPNGPKKVREIKVGDQLFDRLGKPTNVLGVFPQGKMDVYEITLKDGRKTLCSLNHLWNIHKRSWHREISKDKYIPYTVEQMLTEGLKVSQNSGYRFEIQCANPVQYQEKKYSIDPYVIGVFLGDGCCTQRALTLSSKDKEILEKVNLLIGGTGFIQTEEKGYSWRFQCPKGTFNTNNVELKYFQTKNFFKNYQKEICQYSYNKSIPIEYKYGSIDQRLKLIQGLMDTDGSITKKGHVTFTSTSLQLINDVKEVLGSLGYVSTLQIDQRDKYTNNICYILRINIPNKEKEKLFSLKRKKEIAKKLPPSIFQYNRTQIKDIKKLDYQEEMTCFLVDNEEHLFLINDFIVTHNTTFEDYFSDFTELCGNKVYKTSMVRAVKNIAQMCGWQGGKGDKDRKFLADLKTLLDDYNNFAFESVVNDILRAEKEHYDYIFIDAREPRDIDRLKNISLNCYTVLITRKETTNKVYGNDADDCVFDYNYDYIVSNNSTLDELKESAKTLFEIIDSEEELIDGTED